MTLLVNVMYDCNMTPSVIMHSRYAMTVHTIIVGVINNIFAVLLARLVILTYRLVVTHQRVYWSDQGISY